MRIKVLSVMLVFFFSTLILSCTAPMSSSGDGGTTAPPADSLTFSRDSGWMFYATGDVEIKAGAGETIYYTLDGTAPDDTSFSGIGNVTVNLTDDTTVNAIVYENGVEKYSLSADYYLAPADTHTIVVIDAPPAAAGKTGYLLLDGDNDFASGWTNRVSFSALSEGKNYISVADTDWPTGEYYILAKTGASGTMDDADCFGTYRSAGRLTPEKTDLALLEESYANIPMNEPLEILGEFVGWDSNMDYRSEMSISPFSHDSGVIVEWNNGENWFLTYSSMWDSYEKYGWDGWNGSSLSFMEYTGMFSDNPETAAAFADTYSYMMRFYKDSFTPTQDCGHAGGGTLKGTVDFSGLANPDQVTHVYMTLIEVVSWTTYEMVERASYGVSSFSGNTASYEFNNIDPSKNLLVAALPLHVTGDLFYGVPLSDANGYESYSLRVSAGSTVSLPPFALTNEGEYTGNDGIDFTGTVDISGLTNWQNYTGIKLEIGGGIEESGGWTSEMIQTGCYVLTGATSSFSYLFADLDPNSSYTWELRVTLYDNSGQPEAWDVWSWNEPMGYFDLSATTSFDITITD